MRGPNNERWIVGQQAHSSPTNTQPPKSLGWGPDRPPAFEKGCMRAGVGEINLNQPTRLLSSTLLPNFLSAPAEDHVTNGPQRATEGQPSVRRELGRRLRRHLHLDCGDVQDVSQRADVFRIEHLVYIVNLVLDKVRDIVPSNLNLALSTTQTTRL